MTASGRSLWTWTLTPVRVAGDQHRVPDGLEVRLDRVARRARGPTFAWSRYIGLVAEALLGEGGHGPGRGARRRGGTAATPRPASRPRAAARAPWSRRYRPWPPESTTPASRRIGSRDGVLRDGPLGRSTVAARTASMSVVALGRDDGGGGCLADDRQDRALDRLGDRAIRGLRARLERIGEVEAVEAPLARRGLGHARGRSGW